MDNVKELYNILRHYGFKYPKGHRILVFYDGVTSDYLENPEQYTNGSIYLVYGNYGVCFAYLGFKGYLKPRPHCTLERFSVSSLGTISLTGEYHETWTIEYSVEEWNDHITKVSNIKLLANKL